MRTSHFILLSFLSLPLAAQSATGALTPGQSNQPIEITSDALEVLQPKNQAIFTGKVVAIQGDTRLRSERMVVHYRQKGGTSAPAQPQADANAMGAVYKIEAEGNVFLATPKETAKGTRGVYDVDAHEIHLFNNVVLTQGQNVLKGDALVYNLETGRSQMQGAAQAAPQGTGKPSAPRVRMLIVPEQKESQKP